MKRCVDPNVNCGEIVHGIPRRWVERKVQIERRSRALNSVNAAFPGEFNSKLDSLTPGQYKLGWSIAIPDRCGHGRALDLGYIRVCVCVCVCVDCVTQLPLNSRTPLHRQKILQ